MDILLNNMSSANNIVTFTDVPTILSVVDEDYGSYATMTFTFTNSSGLKNATTSNNQWHITFLGETVTNVLNYSDAVGKNFYISENGASTAMSLAMALRSCSTIVANFNVIATGSSVTIKAKSIGSVWTGISDYLDYNIPSTYFTANGTDGEADSSLNGSKIIVDIVSNYNYVTTLEKNFYGGETSFNLSPVLTTISKYGRVTPYELKVNSIGKDGELSLLGNVGENYSSIGYMVNQGNKYLYNDYMQLAQNVSRGENKSFYNNSILYIYEPFLKLSFYNGNDGGMDISVDYVDSAGNVLETMSGLTWNNTDSERKLWDIDIDLASNTGWKERFKQAFYIDVKLGYLQKIRYNVIKPLKATEHCQRIYFRNSYGGISFFDFTGQKTETRDLSIETYEKNIFGYYTDEMNELEKIYNNDVKYNVTLKSHLFENDGKYIFNDMLQSSKLWVERNGQIYAIIIDSINVEEVDQNNIYEATVKFHYSQEPSLI